MLIVSYKPFVLTVLMLSVIYKPFMLSVIMLKVVMLRVLLLSGVIFVMI